MEKICLKCFVEKPIEDFVSKPSRKGIASSSCKKCYYAYRKKYRSLPWVKTYGYILLRTKNKKHKCFKNYGAKGIKNFLGINDLKYIWFRDKACKLKKPSIDRINRFGSYTLENCRYIEHSENARIGNEQRRNDKKAVKNLKVRT